MDVMQIYFIYLKNLKNCNNQKVLKMLNEIEVRELLIKNCGNLFPTIFCI